MPRAAEAESQLFMVVLFEEESGSNELCRTRETGTTLLGMGYGLLSLGLEVLQVLQERALDDILSAGRVSPVKETVLALLSVKGGRKDEGSAGIKSLSFSEDISGSEPLRRGDQHLIITHHAAPTPVLFEGGGCEARAVLLLRVGRRA